MLSPRPFKKRLVLVLTGLVLLTLVVLISLAHFSPNRAALHTKTLGISSTGSPARAGLPLRTGTGLPEPLAPPLRGLPGSWGGGVSLGSAALSPTNVWAVGGAGPRPLVEHWDGHHWSIVASPNPDGTGHSMLYGVSARSSADIWAAGYSYSYQTDTWHPLIEHWNGSQWTLIQSPNFGDPTYSTALLAIRALSPTNVWAVGQAYNMQKGTAQALIEHWNGSQWSIVPGLSARGATYSWLQSIAALSSTNIWAGGEVYAGQGRVGQPLIEHWNGKQWSVVSSPSTSQEEAVAAIAPLSANDIWAGGGYSGNQSGGSRPLVEHWNGKTWSMVPGPAVDARVVTTISGMLAFSPTNIWVVGRRADSHFIQHWDGKKWRYPNEIQWGEGAADGLYSIAALSPTNIWAIGYVASADGLFTGNPLIEHWDGKLWTPDFLPKSSSSVDLTGVTVISERDAWTVGSTDSQTLTEHWDGTKWSVVPSPNRQPTGYEINALSGVAAISSSDVWAVGGDTAGQTGNETLVEHWDGSQWSVVPSPNSDKTGNSTLLAVAASSSNDVWAVGSVTDTTTNASQTLVEHWDGSQWNGVPDASSGNALLSGVVALSSTDAWVVGTANNQTLIEHWNGQQWSVVPSPNDPSTRNGAMFSVTATSASDIWAVGDAPNSQTHTAQPLIEHWDGKQWSVVSSPTLNHQAGDTNLLSSVVALSSTDVWAVGSYSNDQTNVGWPLIEHWDGKQWSIVSDALPNSTDYKKLFAVAAVSSSSVWAVGLISLTSYEVHQPLAEHWDGTQWRFVSGAQPSG